MFEAEEIPAASASPVFAILPKKTPTAGDLTLRTVQDVALSQSAN
jgi:hypothetical protein